MSITVKELDINSITFESEALLLKKGAALWTCWDCTGTINERVGFNTSSALDEATGIINVYFSTGLIDSYGTGSGSSTQWHEFATTVNTSLVRSITRNSSHVDTDTDPHWMIAYGILA